MISSSTGYQIKSNFTELSRRMFNMGNINFLITFCGVRSIKLKQHNMLLSEKTCNYPSECLIWTITLEH